MRRCCSSIVDVVTLIDELDEQALSVALGELSPNVAMYSYSITYRSRHLRSDGERDCVLGRGSDSGAI